MALPWVGLAWLGSPWRRLWPSMASPMAPLAPPKASPRRPQASPRRPQASSRPLQGIPKGISMAFPKTSTDFLKILKKPRKNNGFCMIFRSMLVSSWLQVDLRWFILVLAGLHWRQVGPSWRQVGLSWFKLAPSWPQVGSKLAPCWPMLAQVGPKLAPS